MGIVVPAPQPSFPTPTVVPDPIRRSRPHPSFPRRREPRAAGIRTKPLPPSWGKVRMGVNPTASHHRRSRPQPSFPTPTVVPDPIRRSRPHPSFPTPIPSFPTPNRRSRAGGNPEARRVASPLAPLPDCPFARGRRRGASPLALLPPCPIALLPSCPPCPLAHLPICPLAPPLPPPPSQHPPPPLPLSHELTKNRPTPSAYRAPNRRSRPRSGTQRGGGRDPSHPKRPH